MMPPTRRAMTPISTLLLAAWAPPPRDDFRELLDYISTREHCNLLAAAAEGRRLSGGAFDSPRRITRHAITTPHIESAIDEAPTEPPCYARRELSRETSVAGRHSGRSQL